MAHGNKNRSHCVTSSTLRIILDGVTTPRAPNAGSMPAYSRRLTDQEIADVATSIRNAWGNAAPAVTPGRVAKARRGSAGNPL
jgi:mono/diheme cytochrome c family protein